MSTGKEVLDPDIAWYSFCGLKTTAPAADTDARTAHAALVNPTIVAAFQGWEIDLHCLVQGQRCSNYKCRQPFTEDSNGVISPHMQELPEYYIGHSRSIGYFKMIGYLSLSRRKAR